MAVTIIGGISAAIGAAGAAGALTGFGAFFGFLGTTAGITAFAIGAGLSLVSRALAPPQEIPLVLVSLFMGRCALVVR